ARPGYRTGLGHAGDQREPWPGTARQGSPVGVIASHIRAVLSSLAVANRPSGPNATVLTRRAWVNCPSCRPVPGSHIRAVMSLLAVASRPSGPNARQVTSKCRSHACHSHSLLPVPRSQTRAHQPDPVAMYRPSGLIATAFTGSPTGIT